MVLLHQNTIFWCSLCSITTLPCALYLVHHNNIPLCIRVTQVLQEVLCQGAHPDIKDEHDMTPLHRACKHGHLEVVEALLRTRKVDVRAVDKHGWPPVLYAAASGAGDVVLHLLADKQHVKHLLAQRVKGDMDHDLDVLLLGARYGHAGVVAAALDAGADLASKNQKGQGALCIATLGTETRHFDTVQLLLERKARHDMVDNSFRTPLLYAAAHTEFCQKPDTCQHQDMVQLLRKHGASMHYELLHAAAQGKLDVVKQQLRCKCDSCMLQPAIQLRTSEGWTALSAAANRGHASVVAELIASGAEVDAVTTTGRTPLMLAARRAYPDVVQVLLAGEARKHIVNSTGHVL